MGKQWDGGDVAFRPETWREVYRVLKPGAHLLAFGGTRTYHRMACAIEDAGFEIRDTVLYLYGSGFPKSHDVSKGIDRAAGVDREIIGQHERTNFRKNGAGFRNLPGLAVENKGAIPLTAPTTDAARQWEGWGTALKPACEPIVLARKPLSEGTVAANVLKWGTGAINVDGCRVEADGEDFGNPARFLNSDKNLHDGWQRPHKADADKMAGRANERFERLASQGRWPANVIHDGSDEVVAGFPETEPSVAGIRRNHSGMGIHDSEKGTFGKGDVFGGFNDEGSAARFFYTAKADQDDRLGSKHPTVKPLDLMQYLIRLVTPQRGTVVDPFAGTGTTGEAAWREGMGALLIEREAEYQEDIRRRMALCLAGPDERTRATVKAKMAGKPIDHGPLFGGGSDAPDISGRKIYGVYADEKGKPR
jgi:site-specific DNA-methyltransferase (adenine-specific)